MTRRLLLLALVLCLPACATRPETTTLQSRPDRLVTQLPNRMIVVVQRVPTAPVVSAQVWVKTGSLYEQEHVGAGLSHFLEHLLAGGATANRTEAQSNAALGAMGAQTNAATSLDTVRYYINTTADHADDAVDLLSDWLAHGVIDQAAYERERDVIQREFDMGRGDPGRILWKLTQQARFSPGHPASHPTIGYLPRFLDISRDEIDDFYRRMYAPNNLVFVVAGDVDPRAVTQQIATLWKDAQPQELPKITLPVGDVPAFGEPVVGYAAIRKPRARLIWPGTQLATPGDYELDLLSTILGSGESSRLARTVRDSQRLVTSIAAYNSSFTWDAGFFGVDFESANNGLDATHAAIDAVLEQVRRLRDEKVSDAELARAKRQVLVSVMLDGQSAQNIASRLANDITGIGDPDYLDKYARAVQSLTADDLQRAAQKYLDPDRFYTALLLPTDEAHPVTDFLPPDGEAAAPPAAETRTIDLDNAALAAKLRENLAESDTRAVAVDAPVVSKLDSGLTLIVQRSTVVPGVAMQFYTLGGLLADDTGREGVAYAMAAMLDRGTATRTAAEIHETVEGLGAGLGAEAGNNTTYARATSLSEDWPTVMELLADVVQRPAFPEEEWSKLQPRLLAAIDRETDRWNGELRTRFQAIYYKDHPWSQPALGRRSVVESLTSEDLRAFHAGHFRAADSILSVVGDVDPAQVKTEVEKLFDELPAGGDAFTPPQPPPAEATVATLRTDKPLTAVQIGFGPGVERNHPDYAAVQVLANVMSDFPSGWLEQALRGEGPGLVYAVGAGIRVGIVPGYFAVLFNTDAEKAPEAIRRAMAVADRARSGNFDNADIARAKARVLSDELLNKQDNSSRAADLALDRLYRVPQPGLAAYKRQIESVDAATLRRVARQYLVNPVIVTISNADLAAETIEAALQTEPAIAK